MANRSLYQLDHRDALEFTAERWREEKNTLADSKWIRTESLTNLESTTVIAVQQRMEW